MPEAGDKESSQPGPRSTTIAEIQTLRRRYRRLLQFDRGVCLIYCLTALLPIYGLIARQEHQFFHVTGIILILAVGLCGAVIDTRILNRRLRTESSAYLVTLGFVLSRGLLAVWAVLIVDRQINLDFASAASEDFGSLQGISFGAAGHRAFALVANPPMVWLVFLGGFYRVLYHISVHFLLRIESSTESPSHQPPTVVSSSTSSG